MIGKADMTIWGWKQLILWSIEHSCMEEQEMRDVLKRWEKMWDEFVAGTIQEYGHVLPQDWKGAEGKAVTKDMGDEIEEALIR